MKWIKRFFFLFLILIVAAFIFWLATNEKKPIGQVGLKADQLAQKMMQAVDKAAWDTTGVLQWNFANRHDFLWDKVRNFAEVTWDKNRVQLRLNDVDGRAWKNEIELKGKEAKKLISKAWGYWCNDSFWFNAVVKAFDPGTSRRIVQLEDGSEALMVSYDSGGVTPGDSYLWILDENGLPKSWKMWVKIIPFGGMEFSWENWKTLSTGAKIATLHKSKVFDLEINDVKGATNLSSFGFDKDPFDGL